MTTGTSRHAVYGLEENGHLVPLCGYERVSMMCLVLLGGVWEPIVKWRTCICSPSSHLSSH